MALAARGYSFLNSSACLRRIAIASQGEAVEPWHNLVSLMIVGGACSSQKRLRILNMSVSLFSRSTRTRLKRRATSAFTRCLPLLDLRNKVVRSVWTLWIGPQWMTSLSDNPPFASRRRKARLCTSLLLEVVLSLDTIKDEL